jgi:hypothetical protein
VFELPVTPSLISDTDKLGFDLKQTKSSLKTHTSHLVIARNTVPNMFVD